MSRNVFTPLTLPLGAGVEAIYAGVDWFAGTLRDGAEGYWGWIDVGRRIIEDIAREGEKLEASTWNGFHGLRAGGSCYGVRDGDAYIQLSGHSANDHIRAVYRDDMHISRLDLQATVRYAVKALGIGPQAYQEAIEANETLPKARQRRIWYMSGNDEGHTTYIGSPKSNQRARIYNKEAQSILPGYERCWRWEVMTRNEYATAWAAILARDWDTASVKAAGLVSTWLQLRGVVCEWAQYIPLLTLPLIREVPSDTQRRLEWLRTQVRPVVRWLVSQGHYKELFEALDLPTTDI